MEVAGKPALPHLHHLHPVVVPQQQIAQTSATIGYAWREGISDVEVEEAQVRSFGGRTRSQNLQMVADAMA
jgi:hypothetical protein